MPSEKVAKRYAGSPKIGPKVTPDKPDTSTPGAAPKADEMAGTAGIPVEAGERQTAERKAMMTLHQNELKDMQKRQLSSIAEMGKRHLAELGGAPKKD